MFAKRMKEAMQNSGINQKQLCEITGLSKSGISQYCSGKNKPGEATLKQIANALNVSVEWLIEDDTQTGNILPVNNLSLEVAAKLMGVGRQFIREGLKRGTLPIGTAVKFPSGKYRYYISVKKFTEFTGIEVA
ncbi:MAG: helix-turn-helix transcriptional regulator [Oscillospiraceae bacterium]|nr:helix-turn-helix transcriptional regulator [Oscillospiraceae bacterium]